MEPIKPISIFISDELRKELRRLKNINNQNSYEKVIWNLIKTPFELDKTTQHQLNEMKNELLFDTYDDLITELISVYRIRKNGAVK